MKNDQKQRIFIALKIPLEIRKKLYQVQKKYRKLNVRWTPLENIHLTLAFLGNIWPEEITKTSNIVEEVGERYEPFKLQTIKACAGPNPKNPHLIWVELKENNNLAHLVEDLRQEIPYGHLKDEKPKRVFHPHITIARNRGEGSIPKIACPLDLKFKAETINIMKSELKPNGAKYSLVGKIKLI